MGKVAEGVTGEEERAKWKMATSGTEARGLIWPLKDRQRRPILLPKKNNLTHAKVHTLISHTFTQAFRL